METDTQKIEIHCDDQASQELKAAFPPGTEPRFIERRNITGDPATWTVIATLTVQALSTVIEFLIKWRELSRVRKIKVGTIEIENPSAEDIERLTKAGKAEKGRKHAT